MTPKQRKNLQLLIIVVALSVIGVVCLTLSDPFVYTVATETMLSLWRIVYAGIILKPLVLIGALCLIGLMVIARRMR